MYSSIFFSHGIGDTVSGLFCCTAKYFLATLAPCQFDRSGLHRTIVRILTIKPPLPFNKFQPQIRRTFITFHIKHGLQRDRAKFEPSPLAIIIRCTNVAPLGHVGPLGEMTHLVLLMRVRYGWRTSSVNCMLSNIYAQGVF